MVNLNTTETHNDVEELWSKAVKKPVTVLSAGQAVAVVLSPAEFEKFTARRRGAKAGFARHLFGGIDLNALLDTGIDDVFEGYHCEVAQGAR